MADNILYRLGDAVKAFMAVAIHGRSALIPPAIPIPAQLSFYVSDPSGEGNLKNFVIIADSHIRKQDIDYLASELDKLAWSQLGIELDKSNTPKLENGKICLRIFQFNDQVSADNFSTSLEPLILAHNAKSTGYQGGYDAARRCMNSFFDLRRG